MAKIKFKIVILKFTEHTFLKSSLDFNYNLILNKISHQITKHKLVHQKSNQE